MADTIEDNLKNDKNNNNNNTTTQMCMYIFSI